MEAASLKYHVLLTFTNVSQLYWNRTSAWVHFRSSVNLLHIFKNTFFWEKTPLKECLDLLNKSLIEIIIFCAVNSSKTNTIMQTMCTVTSEYTLL